MECNKEEARRAKEIAEGKMHNKDFLGAKKIVLKAQQLSPDLENISQMLTVCEVHCCAAVMINGEKDWYGILQVEQFADESSIKKQYRKLALQLHPDKNKFAGAEAAFKLIGEAHMILSDRGKRYVYDSKRRLSVAAVPRQPSHQPTRPYFAKPPGVPGNFTNSATHFANITQQQSSTSNMQSFWTVCTRCGNKYEYIRALINRTLRCQKCLFNFTAYEIHAQTVPAPVYNSTQPLNRTQNFKPEIPGHPSSTGFQGNVAGAPTAQNYWSSSGINVASKEKQDGMAGDRVHFEKVNIDKGKKGDTQMKRPVVNAKRKRGRKSVVESSESSDLDSNSTDSEDILSEEEIECPAEQNAGTSTGRYPRRSNRAKQNVTYNEEPKEEEEEEEGAFVIPPKRLRKGGSSFSTVQREANSPVRNSNGAQHTVDSSTNDSPDLTSFSYPDPEFGNFEGERVESKFEAGQIWAIYDNLDAMPRYYARIREVCVQEFRLQFNWLEHNAVSDSEIAWTKAELPVASGNYRLGKSKSIKSLQMFSHLMCREKGARRNTYDIYPRKKEVWALYKGWDIKWISNADSPRNYEYEVVEVVSDFTDSSKNIVVHDLVKIEGFLSLFISAIDKETYSIPSTELLRFSHKVPSYRLTGAEREGTLKGCLELDMASLPSGFADAFPSISLDNAALKAGKFDGASINPSRFEAAKENVAVNEVASNCEAADAECPSSPSLASPLPDNIDYPLGEFHDFEDDKSIEKIKRGQIWALYSDVDQYPKYYAMIKNVADSTVSVSWAELFPQRQDEITWSNRGLPCSCGRFKVERKVHSFDTTDTFSHMVRAVGGRSNLFDIYPANGEVWALYKDWSIEWMQSDLEKCDYDVVEILEHTGLLIRVLVLTKVDGHNTVFMPERKGGIPKRLEIPAKETLRFSHQIPAYRIRDVESSELQGYWELHGLSVPRKFL